MRFEDVLRSLTLRTKRNIPPKRILVTYPIKIYLFSVKWSQESGG